MEITKIETNYKREMFLSESRANSKNYSEKLENQVINIYPNIEYQKLIGFGGAFTESSGYALKKLPEEAQKNVLQDIFGENGLNYTIGRVPIGSSDFSIKSYSYSSKKDLSDFSIKRDEDYIIPLIKEALKIKPDIKFLASPWSPPKFMKNTKMLILGGKLIKDYRETYAKYLVKYIKEYESLGINIEYITVQNEPIAVQIWESCIYSPEEEIDFAVNFLYPEFQKNEIKTKILIWDQNKEKLLNRAISEISDEGNRGKISGLAFHWYTGDHFENIKICKDMFPDLLLFHTEGCTGFSGFNKDDEIRNAEMYAHDILGDLNAGINTYIDWNLMLDNRGGPNHKKNYCNSPIMLNEDNSNYIKNLTYFYIAHFSKYIKPGAKRLAFSRYSNDIEVTAFKNVNNSIIIVLLNRNSFNKEYNIVIGDMVLHDNLDSNAIVTYKIDNL